MIGAEIMLDMTLKHSPDSVITFDNVVKIALGNNEAGEKLRASIEQVADREMTWFRSTPSHILTTDRVMETRSKEVQAFELSNRAVFTALISGQDALEGKAEAREKLQSHLEAAIEAIDEIHSEPRVRRKLLTSFQSQLNEAIGDEVFVKRELRIAEKSYLDRFREKRLAAYMHPSPEQNDDFDM